MAGWRFTLPMSLVMALPAHLGATMPALRCCLDAFGDDLQPGDMLANNDPIRRQLMGGGVNANGHFNQFQSKLWQQQFADCGRLQGRHGRHDDGW